MSASAPRVSKRLRASPEDKEEVDDAFAAMSAANTRACRADHMRSYYARGEQPNAPIRRLLSTNTAWVRETLEKRGALEAAYKLADVLILTWLSALVCQQVSTQVMLLLAFCRLPPWLCIHYTC